MRMRTNEMVIAEMADLKTSDRFVVLTIDEMFNFLEKAHDVLPYNEGNTPTSLLETFRACYHYSSLTMVGYGQEMLNIGTTGIRWEKKDAPCFVQVPNEEGEWVNWSREDFSSKSPDAHFVFQFIPTGRREHGEFLFGDMAEDSYHNVDGYGITLIAQIGADVEDVVYFPSTSDCCMPSHVIEVELWVETAVVKHVVTFTHHVKEWKNDMVSDSGEALPTRYVAEEVLSHLRSKLPLFENNNGVTFHVETVRINAITPILDAVAW